MHRRTDALDLARTSAQLGLLAWEAQAVMTMRVLGMAGAWSVLPSENARMIAEKGPAFADAAAEATRAALSGRRPDQVVDVWTRSLRRRTGRNARRLIAAGPRTG